MNILDELQWRGLLADCTDPHELAKRVSPGPITLYCGFDPTADSLHVGNLVPLLALRRFQLLRPSPHRRWPAAPPAPSATQRQDPGAPVAHQGGPGPQHRQGQRAAPPPARFRHPDQSRPPARQRDLDRAGQLPRFPARHRQALLRQPDGGQGKRPRPHGGPRGRHQLHRVQLHAAPGLRLLRPVPRLQLRAADRRQRPVGQHHRRHRPHPQEARPHRLRPHPAAHHQRRRHQVRQDRRRRRLARSRPDQRLQVLPVLDPHRRPRRRSAT